MLSQLTTTTSAGFDAFSFLLCTACSLVLGAVIAAAYMFRNSYSKSFVVTLALLPALVQLVIMLVNGNLGAGVAVAGAFSLVRFRSLPGTAKDIGSIFFAMAIGLATGMGYLGTACIFTVIIILAEMIYTISPFGGSRQALKSLQITTPEELDYDDAFDDLFDTYTTSHELVSVKTTHMGSLFKLQYHVILKNDANQKQFLDELRCRNGNLEISLGHVSAERTEL